MCIAIKAAQRQGVIYETIYDSDGTVVGGKARSAQKAASWKIQFSKLAMEDTPPSTGLDRR